MIRRVQAPVRFAALTVALLASVACTSSQQYQTLVSAYARPEAGNARKYILIPGNENVELNDFAFQEYAAYLHRALELEGFQRADSLEDTDLVIIAIYGVGEPEVRSYTVVLPQWGQTGVSSTSTQGAATTSGSFDRFGNYHGTTTYTGTTHVQPTYGITGYSTGVGQRVTYTRSLYLAALDPHSADSSDNASEVWRLSVVSTGSSPDLRRVFPVLVASARPYFARATTGGVVTITLSEGDKRIRELREEAR